MDCNILCQIKQIDSIVIPVSIDHSLTSTSNETWDRNIDAHTWLFTLFTWSTNNLQSLYWLRFKFTCTCTYTYPCHIKTGLKIWSANSYICMCVNRLDCYKEWFRRITHTSIGLRHSVTPLIRYIFRVDALHNAQCTTDKGKHNLTIFNPSSFPGTCTISLKRHLMCWRMFI